MVVLCSSRSESESASTDASEGARSEDDRRVSRTPTRGRSPLVRRVDRQVLGPLSASAIGRIARRLGIADVLRSVRERLLLALTADELTLAVGGTTLRFGVANEFEYEQFERVRTDPDRAVLTTFTERVRPDDVLWDVGANVGVFSCFGAANGLRAVAVEPNPANVDRIRENLARNGLEASVVRSALSDYSGRSRLRTSIGPPDGAGAFGYLADTADGDGVPVRVTTATALVEEEGLALPTVLKIDVEGEELSVLRGFGDALADCRLVYCNVYEKHFETGTEGRAVRELLEGHGLSVARIGDWQGGYFLRAHRGEE